MSGVVYRPPAEHECAPGWEWKPNEPGSDLRGSHYGVAPTTATHPRGTVWECDCGLRWISRGTTSGGRHPWGGATPCVLEWRREGWFARWRRTRRQR